MRPLIFAETSAPLISNESGCLILCVGAKALPLFFLKSVCAPSPTENSWICRCRGRGGHLLENIWYQLHVEIRIHDNHTTNLKPGLIGSKLWEYNFIIGYTFKTLHSDWFKIGTQLYKWLQNKKLHLDWFKIWNLLLWLAIKSGIIQTSG